MKELSCTYTVWLARSAPRRRDRRARGRPPDAGQKDPGAVRPRLELPGSLQPQDDADPDGVPEGAEREDVHGLRRAAAVVSGKRAASSRAPSPVSASPAAAGAPPPPPSPPLGASRARAPNARPPHARSRLSRTVKPAGSPVFMSFSTSSSFSPGSSTCAFVDGASPKRPAAGRRDATRRGGRVRGRSRAARTRRCYGSAFAPLPSRRANPPRARAGRPVARATYQGSSRRSQS